eukprot:4391287-Amphidinium_carterae.1
MNHLMLGKHDSFKVLLAFLGKSLDAEYDKGVTFTRSQNKLGPVRKSALRFNPWTKTPAMKAALGEHPLPAESNN